MKALLAILFFSLVALNNSLDDQLFCGNQFNLQKGMNVLVVNWQMVSLNAATKHIIKYLGPSATHFVVL